MLSEECLCSHIETIVSFPVNGNDYLKFLSSFFWLLKSTWLTFFTLFFLLTELHASSAGLFIQESPPGYSYSDYIQDLEAEDRFQDSVENESLQFEDVYNKTQMKALVIFIEQQAKYEYLYKVRWAKYRLNWVTDSPLYNVEH